MFKKSLTVFLMLSTTIVFCLSSSAMTLDDATNAEYLKKQGYSPELIRLVDVQKNRVEEKTVSDEKNLNDTRWTTKAVKAVKQWAKMSDVTMSPDFGNNQIKY
jgi:hypothetical protein